MQALIHFIADGTVIIAVLIAVFALVAKIPNNKKYAAYCRILMAGLTAMLVAKLMATFIQPAHERPFELLGVAPGAAYLNNPGFPSDHALFVTALTLAVWFETKRRYLAYAMLLLLVLVSIGRVAALVHTPLDVIGGIFAGLTGVFWYAPSGLSGSSKSSK